MRIQLDRTLCQGHGNCYNHHPKLFAPDEEAFAELSVTGGLDADRLESARIAVAGCPERAISIVP
jgi:ferredoxin